MRITEHVIPGKRLGRHIGHDPRSLGFPYRAPSVPLANVHWQRMTPILDQGDVGSCTGNAITGALGTMPLYGTLPAVHPELDETEALALYHAATVLDSFPGTYPPNDTGSDGVSAAKAAQQAGLISAYTHCFDAPTALQALMAGPVIIGLNWYSSFDTPAADGTISIGRNATIRGGHEVVARGIDVDTSMVLLDNSWSDTWGNAGSFQFSFATLTRLLAEDGDCTVPVALSAPVPPAPWPIPVIYTTDGTMSLWQISANKHSPVSTILRTTLQNFKAYSSVMSAYLQRGDLTLPMPSGEQLCIAWPQYHFA